MFKAVAYGMRFFMSLSKHTECLVKFHEMKHFYNLCSIIGSANLLTQTTLLYKSQILKGLMVHVDFFHFTYLVIQLIKC